MSRDLILPYSGVALFAYLINIGERISVISRKNSQLPIRIDRLHLLKISQSFGQKRIGCIGASNGIGNRSGFVHVKHPDLGSISIYQVGKGRK